VKLYRRVDGILPTTVASLALLLVTIGCSSSSASSTPPRPSTPATVQIVAPAPNATTGSAVDLVLQLAGAHLVPPTQVGGALRPDEGHIHVAVDGQLVAMPAVLTYPVSNLAPGSHTIEAEFVASDHLPFANRVVAAVTFQVK
jgi:hypothetical protein